MSYLSTLYNYISFYVNNCLIKYGFLETCKAKKNAKIIINKIAK